MLLCCLFCTINDIVRLQACRGGGEVSRPAPTPSADLSGQTNHQQGDGTREDEESRAIDAAKEPCSGETSVVIGLC